ncbi:MAG TPA: hypothetical protein VII79_05670 [Candidatus Dormibacteraeota bacterium]
MDLALKLTITPIAIGLATVVARRRGPALGGWVAAIPFTSAPVVLFLSLDRGTGFATTAALGMLAATASQAAFVLAYAWLALRYPWYVALGAGSAGFVACTVALNTLHLTVTSGLAIVVGAIVLALALLPTRRDAPVEATTTDVPVLLDVALRAVIVTAVVVTISAIAPRVGPTLAGLLSPFPLFGAAFMIVPHRRLGSAGAMAAARGLLWGLFATCGFFAVLAQLLPAAPLALAYLASAVAAVAIQLLTLAIMRRWSPAGGVASR